MVRRPDAAARTAEAEAAKAKAEEEEAGPAPASEAVPFAIPKPRPAEPLNVAAAEFVPAARQCAGNATEAEGGAGGSL